MKLKLIILFLSVSFSSIIFGIESKTMKSKKQLSNIEKLSNDMQLHIISYVISKPATLEKVIEYLKKISLINRHFNKLIIENINYIIYELANLNNQDPDIKEYELAKINEQYIKEIAMLFALNGPSEWMKNLYPQLKIKVILGLASIAFSKENWKFNDDLRKILCRNKYLELFINENIEEVINKLADYFEGISPLEIAKKLGVEELQWMDSIKEIKNDTVRIKGVFSTNKDILAVVKTHDNETIKREFITSLDDYRPMKSYNKLNFYENRRFVDLQKRNGQWDKIEFYKIKFGWELNKRNVTYELINTYIPSGNTKKLVIWFNQFGQMEKRN